MSNAGDRVLDTASRIPTSADYLIPERLEVRLALYP